MDSPIGRLVLWGDGEALAGIALPGDPEAGAGRPAWKENPLVFREAVAQLGAYFRGERRSFDLPLRPAGTPFQRRVWEKMTEIPFGRTVSYAELARRAGAPTAVRAVGAACGRNPLPIVVPCHRVVGAGGRLTGYRGGLEIKRKLLALESGRAG
jgi:methylated-DNA-[protein]-cysteine S-methyltransferase